MKRQKIRSTEGNPKNENARSASLVSLMPTDRDIYRVLWCKFASGVIEPSVAPLRFLNRLRQFLVYRDRSIYQLRRLVKKVLNDPRTHEMLAVEFFPPINSTLSQRLKQCLPELQEVIVIPTVTPGDLATQSFYLGLAAAQAFGPRVKDGQGIGIGGGRSVSSFITALPQYTKAKHLRLYALTNYQGKEVSITDASRIIAEVITRHIWHTRNKMILEGFVYPNQINANLIDWVFIGVGALINYDPDLCDIVVKGYNISTLLHKGIVAEILFHFFTARGLPPYPLIPLSKSMQIVSISLLRKLVQNKKQVVVIAGGKEKALAIWAVYQVHKYGGAVFNTLVTDEECAHELLHLTGWHGRINEIVDKKWQEITLRFRAVHLCYGSSAPCRSITDLSHCLKVSRRRARHLLIKALQGDLCGPPLVSFAVRSPSAELDLEIKLIHRLSLIEARVVPTLKDYIGQLRMLALAAAQLFHELLQNVSHMCIGLGSGRPIRLMIESMNFPNILLRLPSLQHLEIWALSDSPVFKLQYGIGAQDIVGSIILRCRASPFARRLRGYVYRPDENLDKLDIVFVTLGTFKGEHRAYLESLSPHVNQVAHKVVGTMLNQLFDAKGQSLLPELATLARSLPIDYLKTLTAKGIPVIALVEPQEDVHAILTACRTGLVNGLIIDTLKAQQLIQCLETQPYLCPSQGQTGR